VKNKLKSKKTILTVKAKVVDDDIKNICKNGEKKK